MNISQSWVKIKEISPLETPIHEQTIGRKEMTIENNRSIQYVCPSQQKWRCSRPGPLALGGIGGIYIIYIDAGRVVLHWTTSCSTSPNPLKINLNKMWFPRLERFLSLQGSLLVRMCPIRFRHYRRTPSTHSFKTVPNKAFHEAQNWF